MNEAMLKYWQKREDIDALEMAVHEVVYYACYLTKKYGMSKEYVNELIEKAYGNACVLTDIEEGEVKLIKFKGLRRKGREEECQ